jgi:hypothetical protein
MPVYQDFTVWTPLSQHHKFCLFIGTLPSGQSYQNLAKTAFPFNLLRLGTLEQSHANDNHYYQLKICFIT